MCAKSSKEKTCVRTSSGQVCGLNNESGLRRTVFVFCFKDSSLGITRRSGVCRCLRMGYVVLGLDMCIRWFFGLRLFGDCAYCVESGDDVGREVQGCGFEILA